MLKNDHCNCCRCVWVDEKIVRKVTTEMEKVLEEAVKDGGGSGDGQGGRRDDGRGGEESGGWWR